jgi:CRP-like cAMP-binding protein
MDDRERLAALPWFAGLEPDIRDDLIARGHVRRRAAGEWLYGEGDEDTGVVAVLEGGLHLHAQAPGGVEVLFCVLPAGGVIGQSRLFGGGPRLVTAICPVESRLFLLPDPVLRQAAAAHPQLWRSLSALVYGQLRTVVTALAEFVALSPRERLMARLLAFSAFQRRIPTTQGALAEIVGASRGAVNGWLRELEAGGRIALGYGFIEVLDPAALRRFLDR